MVITQTRHVLYTGLCTRLYILLFYFHSLQSYKRDHYVFYGHVDTRISSLRYIKLNRLDNNIKTKLVQIMKLKENQEKKCHIAVSNPHAQQKLSVHGAEQSDAKPTRIQCLRYPRAL